MDNEKKQEVVMNKPSPETMMRVYEFFMRTSIPRILAEEKSNKGDNRNANHQHR
jgi:hypothetical protein